LSKVIKSFRIIEKANDTIFEEPENVEEKLLIEEARKKYDSILEKANEEAEKIMTEANEQKENHLNEAYEKSKELFNEFREKGHNEGYNKGYEEGYSVGYTKGYDEGKTESKKLIQEAIDIKNECIKDKDSIYREIEEDVIELVIDICEKVIYEKIDEDKEYIVSLILKGIESLNATENLVVRVSREDYDIVEMSKDKILAKTSLINELEVKADSNLKKGDCIIETSSGNVDMSVQDQVEKVKELLNNILISE